MAQEKFSCCSFYEVCNYGRNECYYADTEPDMVNRCRCYQIKHSGLFDKIKGINKETKETSQPENEINHVEQLILF